MNRFFIVLIACLSMWIPVSAWGKDKTTAAAAAGKDTAVLEAYSRAVSGLAAKARPAVVSIYTTRTMRLPEMQVPEEFRNLFPPMPQGNQREFQSRGLGSGFIIDSAKGYVLTNNHVIDGAEDIKVRLVTGEEVAGKLVGTDKQTDIAVIQIEAKDLTALPLGNSDSLLVGEFVMAIGSPFGLSETVSTGIVSGLGRTGLGIEQYEDFIQTDAAINMGNSGGPLLNSRGEAVGVNTAIVSRSGGSVGVGFAIPIKMAKSVVDQLIASGKVTRGWLGVRLQDVTPELAQKFKMEKAEGVLVSEVLDDTPAGKAGMKAGDVIIEFNGQKVDSVGKLRSAVAATEPETGVPVVVLRDGKRETLTVKVGKQTEAAIAAARGQDRTQALGLTVQTLTPEMPESLNAKVKKGVVVVAVDPGSPAAEQGIQPHNIIVEVNRKPVANIGEFGAALKAADMTKGVLMLVVGDQGNRFVILQQKTGK